MSIHTQSTVALCLLAALVVLVAAQLAGRRASSGATVSPRNDRWRWVIWATFPAALGAAMVSVVVLGLLGLLIPAPIPETVATVWIFAWALIPCAILGYLSGHWWSFVGAVPMLVLWPLGVALGGTAGATADADAFFALPATAAMALSLSLGSAVRPHLGLSRLAGGGEDATATGAVSEQPPDQPPFWPPPPGWKPAAARLQDDTVRELAATQPPLEGGDLTPSSDPAGAPVSSGFATSRRTAALALDLALLFAGLLLVLYVGVSVASAEVVGWVTLVWILVVGPLYFALYHAFGGPDGGPGATPGQSELGLCLRDAQTGERLGLGRSVLRSYGGLVAAALVLPALADLVASAASGEGRPWHDRLFESTVLRVPVELRDLPPTTPTSPELVEVFGGSGALWSRARRLAQVRRSELMTPVLLAYVGLVGLSTVLVPLMVADLNGYDVGNGLALWTALSLLIFLSGIYWTQAVLVAAVEAVRTGTRPSAADLIRRASRRANALTVALVLLTILLCTSPFTLFVSLVLFARFTLVVPTLVLEDTPVLRAFARSWELSRGQTGRAFGLLLASGAVLGATVGIALGVALAIVGAAIPDAGLWAYCLGAAVALMTAAVPMSLVLASLGSVWCLFYYERRSVDDPRHLAAITGNEGAPRVATG